MAYMQRRFYEDFPPVSVCGMSGCVRLCEWVDEVCVINICEDYASVNLHSNICIELSLALGQLSGLSLSLKPKIYEGKQHCVPNLFFISSLVSGF